MINSYHSSYSLEYYEVGTVYSFYIRKGDNFVPVADDELVEKYAKKLDKIERDTNEYHNAGRFSNLVRTCGVVVEKIRGDGNGKLDKIRFMIKVFDEDGVISYGTKLYAVNYKGVETDGWESMPVETELLDGKFYIGTTKKERVPSIKHTGSGHDLNRDLKGRPTVDESTDSKGRPTLDEDDPTGSKKTGTKSHKTESNTSGRARVTIDESVDPETGRVTLDE